MAEERRTDRSRDSRRSFSREIRSTGKTGKEEEEVLGWMLNGSSSESTALSPSAKKMANEMGRSIRAGGNGQDALSGKLSSLRPSPPQPSFRPLASRPGVT